MEKRITKAMNFEDTIARLSGDTPTHGTTLDQNLLALAHELNLLARKNSGDKKPTKTQAENVAIKTTVLNFLRNADSEMTISVIQKACPEVAEMSNQKVSAIVRQLVEEGSVTKNSIKRVSFFKATDKA